MSAQLNLLAQDYQLLSKEAGRRHSDVRDAADKAHNLIKSSREQALIDLRADPPPNPQPLYLPIFLASATKNAKVIALAVSSLQRLIGAGAVPKGLVGQILETLEQVIPQGVEIQLKILQTLVSLLTTLVGGTGERKGERLVQGEELGRALELSHRLSTSKIPVVASTASATLRQLFMFVFDRVSEEDELVRRAHDSGDEKLLAGLPSSVFKLDVPGTPNPGSESTKAPNESLNLMPAARDAYLLLEDLCLLISGSAEGGPEGEPSFLRWGSLSRTFGLELVESIVSGFGPVVRTHPELLLVLRAHLCPLLIRFLSSPPSAPNTSATSGTLPFSFPLTLRLTRVVFLLLKQFSDLLPLESEVFLCMFVRVIGPGDKGEGEGGHPAGAGSGSTPLWMRVLALEIFRGLCGDFNLMMKFYERYDQKKNDETGGGGSSVFSDLMTAFNRLATEKPAVLGQGAAVMFGSSLGPIFASSNPSSSNISIGGAAAGMIEGAMEMGLGLAQAAGNVVGSSVGVGAATTGLSIQASTLKLQCIDQLDKADAPPIPDTYIFLLALQCLSSLSDGFATYTLSTYSSILASRPRAAGEMASRAPAALDWSTLDPSDSKSASLLTEKEMAQTSWPALLASLSFFIATNLDDDLFGDVVTALQNFTSVCGVLDLQTPREAFLTSLCKFAIPPAVVSHIASSQDTSKPASSVLTAGVESLGLGPAAPLPVGLSSRNFACLKALISVAQYLAGSLNSTWFAVFETLQNADFVIKTNATRNKKRSNNAGPPATPPRPGAAPMSPPLGATNGSASNGMASSAPATKIPVLPSEADETAMQASIAKLFEVSRSLDDDAFKWFVGALCRLNGEMMGIAMAEDGQISDAEGSHSPVVSPYDGPVTLDRRRRSSGINTIRTLRSDEKSFGVSKLGVVSLLNVHRLIYRDAAIGWDIVTSHLLYVQHHTIAPQSLRLQAAEVLDQILVVAPKNISTGGDELQRRIQTQVLVALAAQAEPALRPQSSTDIEIRRLAFETLIKILESNGHSFIAGWERIFHVLRTACPPPNSFHAPSSPILDTPHALDTIDEREAGTSLKPAGSYFSNEKSGKTAVLVRSSFPSLQLICTDFLGALTIDELRDCIATLAEFGKQGDDVNVALTAGGLLWSVSDHVQAKRKEGDNEVAHGELWMFLLHQLLASCRDSRQEVRDGAIATIFRSISLYGSTLSKATWDACMWEVVFVLVDDLSKTIAYNNKEVPTSESDELVTQVNGPQIRLLDKQWDDSKTLALKLMGGVFYEYLPKIVKTSRYEETWAAFVGHLKRSFVEDRPQAATAAMQAFEKILTVSLDGAEASRIASSWEVAWAAWDDIGHSIDSLSQSNIRDPSKTYTQINLESYIRVALPIYTPPYISFDLSRIHRLLAILKSVLTFPRSPDFRPDVDALTPLQAAVLEVVAAIKLELPGAASAVLSDLSEYLTLAFVAAFDAEPDPSPKARSRPVQRVTYIALSKEVMPHVLWLFQRYKDDSSIFEQGAVERMLAAYALPMKLKHDCPAPSKYGSDELLWKTATVNFLKAVKDCVTTTTRLAKDLPATNLEGIWRQIVEGFRGALLADSHASSRASYEEQHAEENFDLALLLSLEQDVIPLLGSGFVPDELIRRLSKCLQSASRLYELDLATANTPPSRQSFSSEASTSEQDVSISSAKETRFDPDFDRQAKGEMFGTTAEVVEVGRERFRYWCFDLLFMVCCEYGQDYEPERRRIAALALPMLLNRCAAVIKTYVADAPLRGKMPFPRVRQEELIYVLQKLLHSRLRSGTLWASAQEDPSTAVTSTSTINAKLPPRSLVRSALLRSPLALLYELHSCFTALLSLSTTSPSITSAYIPYRRLAQTSEPDSATFVGLPEGFKVVKIGRPGDGEQEGDVVQLALACLKKVGEDIGAGDFFSG